MRTILHQFPQKEDFFNLQIIGIANSIGLTSKTLENRAPYLEGGEYVPFWMFSNFIVTCLSLSGRDCSW